MQYLAETDKNQSEPSLPLSLLSPPSQLSLESELPHQLSEESSVFEPPPLNKRKEKILSNIINGQLTVSQIENDDNFSKIAPRLTALKSLSTILEINNTKFYAYDNRKVYFATKITADYLAKGNHDGETITFSFFVKAGTDTLCVNSIFPMENYDYSSRQTQYTVLFKKRIEYNSGKVNSMELYRHKNYIIDEKDD